MSEREGGSGTKEVPFRNPGWAGNTGEFELTEEQVDAVCEALGDAVLQCV